jgi:ribosomal L10p-like protein
MSKALGQTPETAILDNIERLSPFLTGDVGLLLTNRPPEEIFEYFQKMRQADFARAGATAPRDFIIPQGVVYSTGGEVPREHDVPMEHSIEPELRKLGMPTRMVRGRVVLGEADAPEEPASEDNGGYVVCREGQTLDSRQTRLLKLFSVLLAHFDVKVLA